MFRAVRRARLALTALTGAVTAALLVPALALAQSPGVQRPRGPASEQTPGMRGGEGGLAATGFEVWQVALLGVVLVAVALVLLRGVRTRRGEVA